MKKLCAGDMIAIPSGDRFGLAKVIYISKYFKGVILLKIFRSAYRDANIENFPAVDAVGDLYYTSSGPIKRGRWTIIGCQQILSSDKFLSKRIVAGEVWIEDELLERESAEELVVLPKMDVYGYGLVEKAIAELPVCDQG